jgi:hypothetical protein
MAPINATKTKVIEHSRYLVQPTNDFRQRALVRLYERRIAVDNLIRALERYQKEPSRLPARRAPLSAGEMWL